MAFRRAPPATPVRLKLTRPLAEKVKHIIRNAIRNFTAPDTNREAASAPLNRSGLTVDRKTYRILNFAGKRPEESHFAFTRHFNFSF